ncbi:DUF1801 domain-containing protein [Longimicrobium sp.]|uniref:DUF1801 domain-containing protein n=1 Tax=Longimicrobium sp. TaxID=2029185 RepID=UPI002BB08D94|nr:DUF1801 domain-containing protein [Longimicrobium sp.]HSU17958.1 DUF1801 domain-containing protein [Longimicrobium sp.]
MLVDRHPRLSIYISQLSAASTVEEYLAELPEDRRAAISTVRDTVLRHLPAGYREGMAWGMIGWCVPLEAYPDTYNGQPLSFVSLAAQKNYNALYLTCVYGDPERERRLRDAFAAAGKKLDMGKSCIRFRSPDDLPLDAIGQLIADTPPHALIARHEAVHPRR